MLTKAQPQAHLRAVAAYDRAFTPKAGDPQTAALFGAVVQRRAGKRDGTRIIKAPDPPAQGGGPFPTSPKGTKGRNRNPSGVPRLHRTELATACPSDFPMTFRGTRSARGGMCDRPVISDSGGNRVPHHRHGQVGKQVRSLRKGPIVLKSSAVVLIGQAIRPRLKHDSFSEGLPFPSPH
jgi:hypothetical protein